MTDYVARRFTLHYGATIPGEPRREEEIAACQKLGERLAQWVAVAFRCPCYVHVDGWILAYYMQDEPVAKLIGGKNKTVASTKLENVVAVVAGAGGVPFSGVSYYDFRYPNATHMLFVAEENEGAGNTFTIQIPSSFGYFERSFSVTGWNYSFTLDGVDQQGSYYSDENRYGIITAAQLLPDVVHTIVTANYGVLVIVYRVP